VFEQFNINKGTMLNVGIKTYQEMNHLKLAGSKQVHFNP
jgi:hypothetical protein